MMLTQSIPSLRRVEDVDGWRWYAHERDVENPARWFASVTNVLSVAVHERLRNYFVQASAERQAQKLEVAVDAGHRIHNAIEADLRGEWVDAGGDLERPLLLWRKLKEHHNIKANAIEQAVASEKFGYGGTADVIGEFDGRPCVLDIKTGRFGVKVGAQLAAYKFAYEEVTNRNDLGMVGISIPRDGYSAQPFVYQHVDFCWETFRHCLGVWRALYFYKLQRMKWAWLHAKLF